MAPFEPQAVSESPNHDLLTAKEAPDYLRVPLSSLYYLAQRRQIPAIQIGGRWRIKKSSLDGHVLGAKTRKTVSGEKEAKKPQAGHQSTDQGNLESLPWRRSLSGPIKIQQR